MIPTLRTKRLLLRPAVRTDAPAIACYLNNFAVAGNLARIPYPYLLADAERWLAAACADPAPEETGFAIELAGAGYIGQVGFHVTEGEPELGYWLAVPFWHRGLMTEAAAATIDWLFTAIDAERVRCGAFAFNKASLAVQRKLGFVETGESRRLCLARGEEVRHIDTELSAFAWAGALGKVQEL